MESDVQSANAALSLADSAHTTWNNLSPLDIASEVESMISRPGTKPWNDVEGMNPDLYQHVADALQTGLDNLPALKSGFARGAAIKTLQAISRTSGILPNALWLRNVMKGKAITFGGFADVFEGQFESKKVGLKAMRFQVSVFDNDSEKVPKWFRHEALIWRQLRHPRILPFLGIVDDPVSSEYFYPVCLVSPWMEGGNVRQYLRKNPNSDRLRMALEIIEGIEYLHTHDPQIVHADIRGANILVTDDGTCCLADFGITMIIETRQPTNSRLGKGSTYWMSPEVWTQIDAHCIPARDIYAFGCTVIEIYSGNHPFPDITRSEVILNEVVYQKQKPPRPQQLQEDERLWVIVDACLAYEADSRPTASVVLDRLDTLISSR